MMLGVVCSNSKRMPAFWFPRGLWMGVKEYLEVMRDTIKPWLDTPTQMATTAGSRTGQQATRPRTCKSGVGRI